MPLGVDDEDIVAISERWQQVAQAQSAIGRVQQYGAQVARAVVGNDQFKPRDSGDGNDLLGSREPLRDQFVAARFT